MNDVPLTIVVIPLLGDAPLEGLIERLRSDGDLPAGSEIIVVSSRSPHAIERMPDLRWIACEEGTSVPRRRGLGAAAARGEVIAFVEDTTWPAAGWARAAVELHRAHADAFAIGGTLSLGDALSPRAVALALLDYAAYLEAGTCDEPSRSLPGNNMSFKRGELLASKSFAEGSIREAELFAASLGSPGAVRIASGMHATLLHVDPLGTSLQSRFHHGRLYAGKRSAGRIERLARAALSPTLIPLFAARAGPKLRGVRRSPAVLGHVLWMTAAWSAGEAVGYLYGPGESEKHWR